MYPLVVAFSNHPAQAEGIKLLQRSLQRGRLGHAYLFTGARLEDLEALALTLAKTLNCEKLPSGQADAQAFDSCDGCLNCRKAEHGNHADVHWVRPESKLRQIKIDQIRDLMHEMNLKPTEGGYKVGIIVAADRLNVQAANAFLKTLEEPPARSVLILLSTQPSRLLETILSRCLRLNFGGGEDLAFTPEQRDWLQAFAERAAQPHKSLLSRYLLLDLLLQRLSQAKEQIARTLEEQSPLSRYPDAEKSQKDQWEAELNASIEAEYRRQRGESLLLIQWWLRDVWLLSQSEAGDQTLCLPAWDSSSTVARRITPAQAAANLQVIEQLQSWLHTNVQEALALEVGLLKLNLG